MSVSRFEKRDDPAVHDRERVSGVARSVARARRVRIAYVQSHLFYGSSEAYLHDLIEGIDRARFEPWLVSPDHPTLEPLRQASALAGRVAVLPSERASLPWLFWSRARALRSIRPDLVHCGDFDPPAMLAARAVCRAPVVVTHHTPELQLQYNPVGRAAARAAWALRPWVIVTSEADRATALATAPIRPERTAVIPLGIDLGRFTPRGSARVRSALGIAPGRRVVGTVGLLREQKGHTYLLQAAERLARKRDDIDWLIAGEGELRRRLEDEIRTRGLTGRVRLLGRRDDVPALLSGLDVFALSSTFEGMCLAVAEALAAEVPVAATDVGGVGQSVIHGRTGLLVRPREPDGLAQAIERLLDQPDEARELARAGRDHVRRLYALPRMIEETERLYARAVGRRA
jgi:glycosyltransferase involved in cell wall biosynthesis